MKQSNEEMLDHSKEFRVLLKVAVRIISEFTVCDAKTTKRDLLYEYNQEIKK